MIIEKNGNAYAVIELNDKWTVKTENGKLSVAFDVSKKICTTADELRDYVLQNDMF